MRCRTNLIRPAVLSWAFYDFANTIFSMNVISLYFALWVTKDHGGKDIYYSAVYSASMLLVIFLAPTLGRLADLRERRLYYLVLSTLVCVLATGFIGILNQLGWGLFLFFFANAGYQLALVFYDSLLPSVADSREYGRVSGIGVALGYAGAIAGIALVSRFVQAGAEIHRERAFIPTAILFLAFALPCFLWVREKRKSLLKTAGPLWRETIQAIRKRPGVLTYLAAMFLIQNAASTVILFMGVYSMEIGGFTQKSLQVFFMLSTTVAALTAFFHGRLADWFGPYFVFRLTIYLWLGALLLAAMSRGPLGLWAAGFLIGMGLGGLWTSSRPLLLSLIPEEESATFFGMNVLAGRFAGLVGPLVWGLIVWLLEPWGQVRYRVAIGALFIFMFAGLLVARKIPREISRR